MKKIISFLLLLFFLFLLFRKIDFEKVKESFVNIKWPFVIISILIGLFVFFLKVYRWNVILSYKKNISFIRTLEVLSISQLISYVLPFRAGDVVQIVYLSIKEEISKIVVLTSIAWYQFIDIVFTFLISFYVSFFIIYGYYSKIKLLFLFVLIIIILILLFNKQIFEFIRQHFSSLKDKIDLLQEAIKNFFSITNLLKTISLTIAMIVLGFFSHLFFLKGFNINISPIGVLAFISIPTFVGLIPSTPGFWGTWDFVAVSVLRIFGVEKELALSCVLTMHFVSTCQIALFGGIFMLKAGVKR